MNSIEGLTQQIQELTDLAAEQVATIDKLTREKQAAEARAFAMADLHVVGAAAGAVDLSTLSIYPDVLGGVVVRELVDIADVRALLAAPQQHAQAALSLEQRQNLELVIARLEQIAEQPVRHIDTKELAEQALPCARAILATRQPAPVIEPEFSRDPDGDLCLDWSVGDKSISVSMSKTGLVTWAVDGASGFCQVATQKPAPVAAAVQGDAKPLAYMHILAEGKFGNEGWNTQFLRSPQEAESERAIHGGTVIQLIDAQPSPAQRAASVEAKPEPFQFHYYGLSNEQLQQLLAGGLKPEEIGGADDVQHDRVRELVWWFARFTQGEANPKWATRHACELAYFIAINGINRHIDLKAVRDAAFKEGVNITPAERGTLERIGFATPQPDSDMIGRKISLDVSTCDDDAGRRIFGTVYEVQDGDLLATEDSRNWREPDSGRDAARQIVEAVRRDADPAFAHLLQAYDSAMAAQQGEKGG